MAKAKSKSKASSKKATLPNGYKSLSSRAPNWDFEKDTVIEGERGEVRDVTFDKGTKKERTVQVMTIDDAKKGKLTVWNSATLRPLFEETEEGDSVRVEYLGLAKAKKGQNPCKLFDVAVAA